VQYVMLIYETPKDFEARKTGADGPYVAAWRIYHQSLLDAGVYLGGAPLKPIPTATTVRTQDGKSLVQDGPYAETKEQLGGFILLELPSLDVALSWAARCPAAKTGAVEVRPTDQFMHDTICNP
jgi:hypothetical protein